MSKPINEAPLLRQSTLLQRKAKSESDQKHNPDSNVNETKFSPEIKPQNETQQQQETNKKQQDDQKPVIDQKLSQVRKRPSTSTSGETSQPAGTTCDGARRTDLSCSYAGSALPGRPPESYAGVPFVFAASSLRLACPEFFRTSLRVLPN